MKQIRHMIWLLWVASAIVSCKKDKFETTPLASLRIVNVVTGGTTARLNGTGLDIGSTFSSNFALSSGNPAIYVWPITDSLKPYYDSKKQVPVAEGDYFTLFLGGTPAAPDPILVKESFQNYTDSVMGLRFVNLSPNSTPVNVTLSTATTVNEFAGIAYKQLTDFKLFPAKLVNTTYTFQVRAANNPTTVLASVVIALSGTAAIPRFKNVTLVFRGNVGGTPAAGITRVNHY